MAEKKKTRTTKTATKKTATKAANTTAAQKPARKRVGAKTKLTNKLIDDVALLISNGMPVTRACEYLGINRKTHYEWLKKGRSSEATDLQKRYVFEVMRAGAEFQKKSIEAIQGACKDGKNWQALAWLLERLYPSEFARKYDNFEDDNDEEDVDERFI